METNTKPTLLLVSLKYGLDVLWYLSLAFVIIAILLIAGVIKHPPVDYLVNVKYVGELQETYVPAFENISSIVFLPTEGKLVFKGDGLLPNMAWIYIFSLIMFGLYLVFLYFLRKIFTSFMRQSPFCRENIFRIRILSLCFVVFNLLLWVWDWWCIPAITGLATTFTQVRSISFPGDIWYIIIAIVIYILADIFKYGLEIQEYNKEFV